MVAQRRFYELFLIIIILFQIFDFFKLLTPFWDYVKKIISWVLIGYLLYLTSPSKLFFGERVRWWDTTLILGSFSITLKNIISFAGAAREIMLQNVLKYVTFVPATKHVVASVANITLGEANYNAFNLLGYLPNASLYAKPFAAQLTLTTSAIPFAVTSGSKSTVALLQPYGLNGMILQLYNTLALHGGTIERISFLLGVAILFVLGVYGALTFFVKKESVLGTLHDHGPLKDRRHAITRVGLTLFVIAAFFVLLFNLVVEWLAIAIDAPLAMTGLAVYALIAIKFYHQTKQHLDEEELLSRIANFGTNFLKEFALLFTKKETVLLGVSGMLVLHLLVDIGTFLIPYVTGFVDPLYFGHLGAGHTPLPQLLLQSWNGNLMTGLARAALYTLNVIGLLALFGLPAYIWYKVFRIRTRPEGEAEQHHYPSLPGWLIALCLTGITAFLATPAFALRRVMNETVIGVDLQTRLLTTMPPLWMLWIPALLFLLLTRQPELKKWLMALLFGASILFFATYIYQYFMATVQYYIVEGVRLFTTPGVTNLLLGFLFILLLALNLLFYTIGFLGYVYEAVRD